MLKSDLWSYFLCVASVTVLVVLLLVNWIEMKSDESKQCVGSGANNIYLIYKMWFLFADVGVCVCVCVCACVCVCTTTSMHWVLIVNGMLTCYEHKYIYQAHAIHALFVIYNWPKK